MAGFNQLQHAIVHFKKIITGDSKIDGIDIKRIFCKFLKEAVPLSLAHGVEAFINRAVRIMKLPGGEVARKIVPWVGIGLCIGVRSHVCNIGRSFLPASMTTCGSFWWLLDRQ